MPDPHMGTCPWKNRLIDSQGGSSPPVAFLPFLSGLGVLSLVGYMGTCPKVTWPLQKGWAASAQLQVARGASSDAHGCVTALGIVSASSAVHLGHLAGTHRILIGFRSTIRVPCRKTLYLAWLWFG